MGVYVCMHVYSISLHNEWHAQRAVRAHTYIHTYIDVHCVQDFAVHSWDPKVQLAFETQVV